MKTLLVLAMAVLITEPAIAELYPQPFGSSKYENKTIYMKSGDSVTHTFEINGVFGNSLNSFRTDWYSTEDIKGSAGFIESDSSNLGNSYWDPSVTRTYSSTGTYFVRGEVMTRDYAYQDFWWKETHQWRLSVVVDNTGPYAPGTPDLDAADDSGKSSTDNITKYKTDLTFSWTASSGDTGIGLKGYQWKLGNGSWNDNGTNLSKNIDVSSDGTYTFYVRAIDAFDNPGTAKSISFTVDTVVPNVPSIIYPSVNQHITDKTPEFDWSGSDNSGGSGIWKYHLLVETDTTGLNKIDEEPTSDYYNTPSSPSLDAGGAGYDWELWAYDIAGNKSSGTGEKRFYIDDKMGSVRVDITPASVVNAGAKWQLNEYNSTWRDSGTSVTVPEGNYTIKFNTPSGWTEDNAKKPDDIPITVQESKPQTKTGNYKRILSAYWWDPLDVAEGTISTMCAEVEGFSVGEQFTFELFENDGYLGRESVPPSRTAAVYTENGKFYVKTQWTTVWQSDQSGDPEFVFDISSGSIKKTSINELIVRQKFAVISITGKINDQTSGIKGKPGDTLTGSGTISGTMNGTVTYHWEYRRDPTSTWTSLLAKTVTMTNGTATIPAANLTGITKGGLYYCRVVTTIPNQVNSNVIDVLLNLPPNPPGRIWVEDVTNNSAIIHWDPNTDPDQDLVTYKIHYIVNKNSIGWKDCLSTIDSYITIPNLNSNTEYVVEVKSTDGKGGESDWKRSDIDPLFTTRKHAVNQGFQFTDDFIVNSDQSLGNRIPIILVHGANGDQKPNTLNYWYWWIRDYFDDDRYAGMFKVYRYVYDSSKHIADNGKAFAETVNSYPELKDRKILIMAHSMGGLVARYALNTDTKLRNSTIKLITLGTPHLGSPGANPCWVYAVDDSPKSDFTLWVYKIGFEGISSGDYDLAWYNHDETLSNSSNYFYEVLEDFPCSKILLDNSMKTPFTSITQMTNNNIDSKIIAFSGYLGNTIINGEIYRLVPFSDMINEISKDGGIFLFDHNLLMIAKNEISKICKRNGTYFLENDGLVPLESAAFTTHNQIESINITDSIDEELDHSSYLDYLPVMTYVMSYVLDSAIMPEQTSPADDTTIDNLAPTFTWSAFPDTGGGPIQLGYQLRIRCDSENDAIIYDTGFIPSAGGHAHTYSPGTYSGFDSIADCQRISQSLKADKHYHWHIRYRYIDNGEEHWSRWCADEVGLHQDFYTPKVGALSVTPATGLDSYGYVGSPFTQTEKIYNLTNTGGMTITVSISANKSWISLSKTSISLSPGQSFPLTVSINPNANILNIGNYDAIVSFVNSTNHAGDASRTVSLLISPHVTSLEISGYTSVNEMSGIQYTCMAHYSDGSSTNVTKDAEWSMVTSSPYATVNRNAGYLTTSEVTSDQQCQIEAVYQSKSLITSSPYTITVKETFLSITNVSITEGDSGTKNAVFTVSLSASRNGSVRVEYYTSNGKACHAFDYLGKSGFITFSPGQTSKTISIPIIGDTAYEPQEEFYVNLVNPVNATIQIPKGTGTIIDNESVLLINNISITEGDSGTKNDVFTVSLSPASSNTVEVEYYTSNGKACHAFDYLGKSGFITFSPGQTSKTISIPIIGDTAYEPQEEFYVNLVNPVNATIQIPKGTGTIIDNDPLMLSINSQTITEGNSGSQNAVFTVSLSSSCSSIVRVEYYTSNGKACHAFDYLGKSGFITFSPGQTSKTISIPIIGDTAYEPQEEFYVNLVNPVNATIQIPKGTGTIIDND